MAYSETIEFVVGDTRPLISVTLRDSSTAASGQTLRPSDPTTWAPIDVTGGSVAMFIRLAGTTALVDTLAAVLVTPASGAIVFEAESDTFTAAGTYEAEIQITYADGGIQTLFDLVKFKVRAEAG